jgi:putative FmdB family regulatory protein
MPQYEYVCPHCQSKTTEIKGSKDRDTTPLCEYCPKKVKTKRVMSAGVFRINGYSEANGYS